MKLSKIVIGAMRFKNRASAVEIIRAAIDCGFNYIDTSPCYCNTSPDENSESWVGEAVNHPEYRGRVMVSTKCSPGDGGVGLGEFNPDNGFGVRSKDQLNQVFTQSLNRLHLPEVDYYHLWTTHTQEQLNEAFKPNGWYEGVLENNDKWRHLGITSHADSQTVISFLETGKFETITIPFNVINTNRLAVVEYCEEKGIPVIAMNPFAGGFLAATPQLKELALSYLLTFPNVHILIGFKEVSDVTYAKTMLDAAVVSSADTQDILKKVDELINAQEPRCTACGYCSPCPQSISLGTCLSYYNLYKYMHLEQAKKSFLENQWNTIFRLDRCTSCGLCEKRCPNQLPLKRIIKEAQTLLYSK